MLLLKKLIAIVEKDMVCNKPFSESGVICCDIPHQDLQATTFETVQEMVRRQTALRSFEDITPVLSNLGGTTIYSSQYSIKEYWGFLF